MSHTLPSLWVRGLSVLAVLVAAGCVPDDPPTDDVTGSRYGSELSLDNLLDVSSGYGRDTDLVPVGARVCVPGTSDGEIRSCELDPSVSSASYIADASAWSEFEEEGKQHVSLESPRDVAISTLPDGRTLMVWTELVRSTGLGCGILEGDHLTACPAGWFVGLRDVALGRTPILAELDGHPGLDLFVTSIDLGDGSAADWWNGIIHGLDGEPLPNIGVQPMLWSFDGTDWIDRTEEVQLQHAVSEECFWISYHLIDLDNNGRNEIVTGVQSREACRPAAWGWNDTTGTLDRVDPVTPPSLHLSFYGYHKGPVDPEGVSDFLAVSTGGELIGRTDDGLETTTCWRGTSLISSNPVECPSVFGGSEMGLAFVDVQRDGLVDILTSDEGDSHYCDDVADPFTVTDCYDSAAALGVATPFTVNGDPFVSWSATGVDWTGDGWADLCYAGGWSTNQYFPQHFVCYASDGQGGFTRDHNPIFDTFAEERGLVVWAPPGRDAAPNLFPLDFNQITPWRMIGNAVPDGQMEHILLENADGTPPCNAYVYASVDGQVQAQAAHCTYGYGGFFPPAVWLPPGTEHIKVIWTDGAVSEYDAEQGRFPPLIRREVPFLR